MSLNEKGLAFVKERVRPLAVDSMDEATRVIADELARGPASSTTPEQWARHLAWVIGFDHLIADRKAIHHIVEKIS